MPIRLRIITYNIHRCIGMDRRVAPERVAEVIAVHQPDVVALQEVDYGLVRPSRYDQAAIIAEKLDFPSVWIERERCGNAILSRFPMRMVKAGGLHRPRTWHRPARRGALWVEVDVSGTRIQIINTHLGLTPASRLNQTQVLLGPEWLGSPDCRPPVILCGDFNTQSGSAVFRMLEERLGKVEKQRVNGQIGKTWPSSHPLLNIDHMFLSADISVEEAWVQAGGVERMASDHLPFFVLLGLAEPPGTPQPQ